MMRKQPPRTLRHSSWSLFLVPLALPLVLISVPGTRGPAQEAERAELPKQEHTIEEFLPGPGPSTAPNGSHLRFQRSPLEGDSLRQANIPGTDFLKG